MPDEPARLEIFKIHLKNKAHNIEDDKLKDAAKMSEGLTGADIENLLNLLALNTLRQSRILKQGESVIN